MLGFAKWKVRVAELGEAVDDRAAGIAQAQHLGALVEGFAHGVVDGLPQDFVLQGAVHLDDLRVAAGDQQAQVREGRLVHGLVRLPDEIRQDMALQVVHHHHRDVQRQGQRLGEGRAHQEGAQQARAAGEGDGGEVLRTHARLPQRLGDDRDDVLLVGAGRQFRHHAAEVLMDLLRGDDIGQQDAVAQDGRRGVVAGRFDAEDDVRHRLQR